ncbi:MAG TPA: hypothetical protein DEF41_10135 [Desulfovibrio sp.]|uniref:Uncharacterized protein n=1 Tax=Nitratidesulfovibrio vulgaris (strain ATCC 29579 / DSM 644 / CCUG 34227 / NCIMB 8303 / VKM B-1760 / Hildenborough) TaxID=882 RepID=Q72DB5_NITV2|nr:hypothetical protein DVU_1014 [Nitratidesulfovibrio vulgaris str. Hildenborough]HBW16464.1 hypothetical protein [Desulfovibrio sp.]
MLLYCAFSFSLHQRYRAIVVCCSDWMYDYFV